MLEKHYNPEDALITTLEHLDANSQFFDLTDEEWDDVLYALEVFAERQCVD